MSTAISSFGGTCTAVRVPHLDRRAAVSPEFQRLQSAPPLQSKAHTLRPRAAVAEPVAVSTSDTASPSAQPAAKASTRLRKQRSSSSADSATAAEAEGKAASATATKSQKSGASSKAGKTATTTRTRKPAKKKEEAAAEDFLAGQDKARLRRLLRKGIDPPTSAAANAVQSSSETLSEEGSQATAAVAEPVEASSTAAAAPSPEALQKEVKRVNYGELGSGELHWYILEVMIGKENTCLKSINLALARADRQLREKVERVFIPNAQSTQLTKSGARSTRKFMVLPGSLLVQCYMDNDVHGFLSSMENVKTFMGIPSKVGRMKVILPKPLEQSEYEGVLEEIRIAEEVPATASFPFAAGNIITVMDGPFKAFSGQVIEVFPETDKVKAILSIFGRDTSVELNIDQIESAE
eukprot:jgi/Chlat1/9130/Chrsp97S09280